MDIGTLLRICRERKKLSQEQLAAILNIDRSEVSRYEHNQKRIDLETALAWAKATDGGDVLGWAIAEMFGASEGRWQRVLRFEAAAEQLRVALWA